MPFTGKDQVILAPMTGILNLPLRLAFRKCGWDMTCIGSIDSEVVSTKKDGKLMNILGKEEFTCSDDKPLMIQLMGNKADMLISAMSILKDKADYFNINLGCPLKKVTSKGHGAGLLQQPEKTLAFLEKVSRAAEKPLTVKMRLLEQGDEKTVWFAKRMEELGISGLIIHARTPAQGFSGSVNWEAIRSIREQLTIPVIGNGGIQTIQDIIEYRRITGCDSIMIGATAIRYPFLAEDFHLYLESGIISERNTFGDILNFAGEYATQALALKGSLSCLYHYWKTLHYFFLCARTGGFILRH